MDQAICPGLILCPTLTMSSFLKPHAIVEAEATYWIGKEMKSFFSINWSLKSLTQHCCRPQPPPGSHLLGRDWDKWQHSPCLRQWWSQPSSSGGKWGGGGKENCSLLMLKLSRPWGTSAAPSTTNLKRCFFDINKFISFIKIFLFPGLDPANPGPAGGHRDPRHRGQHGRRRGERGSKICLGPGIEDV